jgi:hypothetical protein
VEAICYYVFKERNEVRNGSHSGANVVTNRVWSCTYRKQGLLFGQQGGQCAGDHDIVVHEPPICHGITKEVSMGARLIRVPIGRIIQALHGLPYSPVTSMTFGSRHAPRQTSSRVYMTIDGKGGMHYKSVMLRWTLCNTKDVYVWGLKEVSMYSSGHLGHPHRRSSLMSYL